SLGVGLAVPGVGTLGIVKSGQYINTQYTNPQGETFTQNIITLPVVSPESNTDGNSSGGNGNEGNHSVGENFSLANMYMHFQVGGGTPMTINMSSVDFGGATQKVLGLTGMEPNDVRAVNLFNAGAINQAALAFGRVNMMYHGNNQFSIVSDESSRFDFNPIIDPNASWGRNAGNILGTMINYNLFPDTPLSPLVPLIFGGPYDVNFNGTATIPR
ncbi:MAG TPA: hypothetical protein DDZ41_08875, partial [Flavobacterium sp.]|nr:hypothetical protein [Flavobacterium sp.]